MGRCDGDRIQTMSGPQVLLLIAGVWSGGDKGDEFFSEDGSVAGGRRTGMRAEGVIRR